MQRKFADFLHGMTIHTRSDILIALYATYYWYHIFAVNCLYSLHLA